MFEDARLAPNLRLAEGRRGRRRRHGALGADGHDRHGAADRVRQRREPAAGPRRRRASRSWRFARRSAPAAAGSRASCCSRASCSGSSAASSGLGLAFGALRAAGRARARQPAAARRHRDRCAGPAVHAGRCRSSPACCSARSRCSSTPAPQVAHGAARRRPTSSASQERHRARSTLVVVAGRAGAGAARQLGPDDSDVPGAAARASRFAHPQEVQTLRLVDSRLAGEGAGGASSGCTRRSWTRSPRSPASRRSALTSTVPMTGDGWHDPILRADRHVSESQTAAAPPVQVRLARPAEDDGRHR